MGCEASRSKDGDAGAFAADESAEPSAASRRFHQDFALSGRKLGRGAFASVYAASPLSARGRHEVAVKVVDLSRSGKASKSWRVVEFEEVALRALPRSKNIVGFEGSYREDGLSYIVLEACPMTLWQAFERTPAINELFMKLVFKDMLSGLQACHGACVVHRDVKGDNFLAVPDSSPLGFRVKLCDFGFASFVGSPDASDLSGVCGTAQLMAPEIVANEAYGAKVDIWALGSLAYVLLFGSWPYMPADPTPARIKAAIATGRPAPRFRSSLADVSRSATSWVAALLERNPRYRPSAQMAMNHRAFVLPWGNGGSADQDTLRPSMQKARRRGAFDNARRSAEPDALDARVAALVHRYAPAPPDATSGDASEAQCTADSRASDTSTVPGSDLGACAEVEFDDRQQGE